MLPTKDGTGGRHWKHGSSQPLGGACLIRTKGATSSFTTHYPGVDIRGLKNADPNQYKKIVEKLVELDCSEIAERSDVVICYWDDSAMRGAGTKGEVTIAKHFGKPVYMVTRVPLNEIPGWVLACTTRIFPTFEELRLFLKSL